jgi:cysteinyl-tRNA synthetase
MSIKIYNTLTRQKETFTPLDPVGKKVKMYTCGQTVYNDIHIGNARFYVAFDAVRRYLAYRGYDVYYVQNYTDVDDKIIARAAEEGKTAGEIAARYIPRTQEDLANLHVLPATTAPCATGEIPEIIAMITRLIQKGAAYERGGTVYFDTAYTANYGKLSRKKPDDLIAGARVAVDAEKQNPADFVLWKPAADPEPYWESPWGNGRPGWHIECSAMVYKYLGEEIDIHGGAADLIFPHHENEIAQTEAITGKPFSKYWMHCGVLTVGHKKMSKSRGNFQTLREVAERFPYDVIRFYLLSGHYRMPMEFTEETITAAQRGLERIKNCHTALQRAATNTSPAMSVQFEQPLTASHENDFFTAMDDDFNTADAITAIFEWVKTVNTELAKPEKPTSETLTNLKVQLTRMCALLGIHLTPPSPSEAAPDTAYIEARIAAREAARKARNFTEADKIRAELAEQGILLEDTREGVLWKKP